MNEEAFQVKVKAAHEAVDLFATGVKDRSWFQRGLDGEMQNAITELREWVICADPEGHITTSTRLSEKAWQALAAKPGNDPLQL